MDSRYCNKQRRWIAIEVAVAYVRVSQEDENPENQKYVISTYCTQHNLKCLFFSEVGVSRTEDPFKRPVFSSLLEFMRVNGIKVLVVESIDRLTAEPEHWDSLINYLTQNGIRLVAVKDEDITSAFEGVIRTIEQLKKQVSSEVLKVVLDAQIDSLKRQIKMYQKLKVAVAKEYVEDVRYKTRRAMARLKEEGKLYHRPTILHYLALYFSRKERFVDLTEEDIERAKEQLRRDFEFYVSVGVPWYRIHRMFLERYADLYRKFPQAPRSYQAIVKVLKEVLCVEKGKVRA